MSFVQQIHRLFSDFLLFVQQIQDLLDNPNPNSPAQADAYMLYRHDRAAYNMRVREQAHAAQSSQRAQDGGGGDDAGRGAGNAHTHGLGIASCPQEID